MAGGHKGPSQLIDLVRHALNRGDVDGNTFDRILE